MKLSIPILLEYLSNQYQIEVIGSPDQTLSLNRPLLYEPNTDMLPNQLYIVRTNSLPSKIPQVQAALICIGERLPIEWMANNNQILLITGRADLHRVFNSVQDIYDKFDAWDYALLEALYKASNLDLSHMIKLGVSVLNNPVYVVDPALQVIYSSKIDKGSLEDPVITVSNSSYPLFLEQSESMKHTCSMERKIKSPFVSVASAGNRCYCYNIYLSEYFICALWVTEKYHPFHSYDYVLADHFFYYYEKAFKKNIANYPQSEKTMVTALRSLLEHRAFTEEECTSLLLSESETWICFKLKERHDKQCMPKDFMCVIINSLMPKDICATLVHSEIVGLLRLTHCHENSNMDFFQNLLFRMDYVSGLSNEFTDLDKFDNFYLQANYVAEKCRHDANGSVLNFFSDFALQYMLHECTGKLPVEQIYPKGLLELFLYDQKKHTEYVKTLNLYLKNEMSIPKTSEQLYLHRTSLLKRLDKIWRIIGDTLDNPDSRLYYRLCFALLENSFVLFPDVVLK